MRAINILEYAKRRIRVAAHSPAAAGSYIRPGRGAVGLRRPNSHSPAAAGSYRASEA